MHFKKIKQVLIYEAFFIRSVHAVVNPCKNSESGKSIAVKHSVPGLIFIHSKKE